MKAKGRARPRGRARAGGRTIGPRLPDRCSMDLCLPTESLGLIVT